MPDGLLNPILRRELYAEMVLIRKFEEKLIDLAKEQARVIGMQILAVGQEAVAAGVVNALEPDDVIVTNHRSHGHLLAKGADPKQLMAEIMGKADGVNKGKAGTLHLSVPEVNAIMTSTVVGASPPLGVGAAFAQQYQGLSHITAVFFGDGAAAEGSVHEAMNMAVLWKLPVLFVCENNAWAGAQCLKDHSCVEQIVRRAAGYDMPGEAVDGNDAEAVYRLSMKMVDYCRGGKGPALIEALTYRMRGHGEHDHGHYMDKAVLEQWAQRCPVRRLKERLTGEGILTAAQCDGIEAEMAAVVDAAVAFGDQSPYPAPEAALEDLWVS
ncbi:MAG: thiamine pyrophosphate-dependent dehydrogenase E1 component subunit alpha [Desulfobacteraceae bacterium]|jgi:pyruvate dehydrogenase E1 component alpha subunit|nr:MAG: thiamine pyrophosphate-dependent dehydrogenase E1 component subunit alpha [Desulfobacteraceae bacterium]